MTCYVENVDILQETRSYGVYGRQEGNQRQPGWKGGRSSVITLTTPWQPGKQSPWQPENKTRCK